MVSFANQFKTSTTYMLHRGGGGGGGSREYDLKGISGVGEGDG